MCKLGGGANRCEAHWGPAQKAADLARRRAKYAAKKGGTVRAYTKQDAQEVEKVLLEAKKVSRFDAEDFKIKAINTENPAIITPSGKVSTQKLKETGEESTNAELAVHSAKLAGTTVEKNYYASETIEGAVNWDNLDEESYRAFGFADMSEPRGIVDSSMSYLRSMSQLELSQMSNENIAGVKLFTSNMYSWVNNSLYNRDKDKCLNSAPIEGQDVAISITKHLSNEDRTVAKLQEVVKQIDEGMSKTSGQQRIVYRGVRRTLISEEGESLANAVQRNFPLGQEMVFDGYQSSSYSPGTAVRYANAGENYHEQNQGVVFEIRTSSGANVISESYYSNEQEVLLPRNARYMVVGNHHASKYVVNEAGQDDGTWTYKGVHVIQLVEITENGEIASAENRPSAPPALTSLQKTEKTN